MAITLNLTVMHAGEIIVEETYERDIVKIGRLASAHLKLEDPKVSRIHAVIEATSDGTGYSVIDMGSAEGTFVNGDRISKHRLSEGDEILVGDTRVVVSLGMGAAAAAVASAHVATPPVPGDPALAAANPAQMAQGPQAQMPSLPDLSSMPPPAPVASADLPPINTGDVVGSMPATAPIAAQPVLQQPGVAPVAQPMMQPGMQPGVASVAPQMAAAAPAGYAPGPESQLPYPQPVYETQPPPAGYYQTDAWGSVPNNLASEGVPDTERQLEIKTLWGSSVLETINAYDTPVITMGDERKVSGWGPLQRLVHCDIEIPSKGLPSSTYVVAEGTGRDNCNYTINIPAGWEGQIERADGTVIPLEHLRQGGAGAEPGDMPGSVKYHLQAEETLYIAWDHIVLQCRYIRRTRLVPPPFASTLNYSWLNVLVLAFFFHLMAIVSFIATPRTQAELTEDIFKNPNRFAQFRLTPEQKKRAEKNSLLAKLRAGAAGAKAKGKEGKAGRKDHSKDKKQGRMAVKGEPDKKELAKSALDKLFGGAKGGPSRSALFGSGGLGGELKGALGGVTGAEVGDATGLGGLGTRGVGGGGGGLSMNSVGLGALGTHGRGGGGDGSGYGEGAAGLGKKADRDINISAGSPIIMGSLDKEIIRRVIKQHLAQIRYCYEKELVTSPGLFGKVATKFTISAGGTVQSASVAQSTLKNAEVERCITAKIRTWRFPKPKGGGIVIVKYPFIFKTAG